MSERWPGPIRLIHWATALFALVTIPAAFAAEALAEIDMDRAEALASLHILIGLAILALTLVRLACRARLPAPDTAPGWSRRLAGLRSALLYALLLALPATGILKLTLSGLDVSAFGVTLIPSFETAPALARGLNLAHAWLGKAFIALALLHAAAALLPRGGRGRPTLGRMI